MQNFITLLYLVSGLSVSVHLSFTPFNSAMPKGKLHSKHLLLSLISEASAANVKSVERKSKISNTLQSSFDFFFFFLRITKHVAFWVKGTQFDTLFCFVSLGKVSICSLEVATRHSWKCRKSVSEVVYPCLLPQAWGKSRDTKRSQQHAQKNKDQRATDLLINNNISFPAEGSPSCPAPRRVERATKQFTGGKCTGEVSLQATWLIS